MLFIGGAIKTVRTAANPRILYILSSSSSFQLIGIDSVEMISGPSLLWNFGSKTWTAGYGWHSPEDGSVDHKTIPSTQPLNHQPMNPGTWQRLGSTPLWKILETAVRPLISQRGHLEWIFSNFARSFLFAKERNINCNSKPFTWRNLQFWHWRFLSPISRHINYSLYILYTIDLRV